MSRLRWVQKKIDSLDPETQYNEILGLMANYQMKPMMMALTYVQAVAGSVVSGPEILIATGKTMQRSEDRFKGTFDTFFIWLLNGTHSEATKKSIEKLNRYHISHASKYPGYFDDNEGAVYATCSIGLLGPHLRKAFGLPPQSEKMNIAWYNFLRDIAEMLRFEHGKMVDFPESYEEMQRWCAEYENRPWPQSTSGKVLMESVVQNYCDRMFPKPLHWFARNLALLATPPGVRRTHSMGEPGRFAGPFVRTVFRTLILFQERYAPDPRVPLGEVLASDEYKQKTAKQTARMKRLYEERVRKGEIPPMPKNPPQTPRSELEGIINEQMAEAADRIGTR